MSELSQQNNKKNKLVIQKRPIPFLHFFMQLLGCGLGNGRLNANEIRIGFFTY